MSCDTQAWGGQTLAARKEEVLEKIVKLNALLARGLVKVRVGSQGTIVFEGWTQEDRGRVSDACAYRKLMVVGSSLAKATIAKAELLAGRKVSAPALAAGTHSHDGGKTWQTH